MILDAAFISCFRRVFDREISSFSFRLCTGCFDSFCTVDCEREVALMSMFVVYYVLQNCAWRLKINVKAVFIVQNFQIMKFSKRAFELE